MKCEDCYMFSENKCNWDNKQVGAEADACDEYLDYSEAEIANY